MFFKFMCLFYALLDISICIPSSDYFFNSNRPSVGMPSLDTTGHASTRNELTLQNLLDNNKVLQNSVHGLTGLSSLVNSNVPSIRISSFASSSPIFTKIFQNEQVLQQLQNQEVVVENAPLHRERRGIVLIDEDFDVPPEPGVKQGWGSDDIHKNKTKFDEKRDIEVMSTEEGSGQTEEVFPTSIIHNTTSEQLKISTGKTKVTKEYDKSTSEYAEKVTLTSEHADKRISTAEHIDGKALSTEYNDGMSSTTENIEGSGEIPAQVTQILETTTEPKEQDEKSPLKVCLQLTCNSNDLLLTPGITRKIPEGTNFTLSCSSGNKSENGLLKLYKYNNSDSSLLEESDKEKKLNFQIPFSQRHHSGTYMCLKFTEESCCHQQLDITVYEVPNYRTHLIVVGLVAAISLFTCVLLGIYRRFKIKNYEVQMELQNMEKQVVF